MRTAYDDLIDFVVSTGVSRAEAELGVRRCAVAIGKHGLVGYTAGGAVAYFLGMNPATAIPYLIGTAAAGAGYGLVKSPQCHEVRQALTYWATAAF